MKSWNYQHSWQTNEYLTAELKKNTFFGEEEQN